MKIYKITATVWAYDVPETVAMFSSKKAALAYVMGLMDNDETATIENRKTGFYLREALTVKNILENKIVVRHKGTTKALRVNMVEVQ